MPSNALWKTFIFLYLQKLNTLPSKVICRKEAKITRIVILDQKLIVPNDNQQSTVLGAFGVVFITFSNFGCKIASVTIQAKSM